MLNLVIYLLLFYNGVHGYRVFSEQTDRQRREEYYSMDPMRHPSQRNALHHLQKEQTSFEDALEHWTGRWMPDHDPEPTAAPKSPPDYTAMEHGVQMSPSNGCDDGKTNLEVDWDHSPINYTCYGREITPDLSTDPTLYCKHIPKRYSAVHACMNETLEYDDVIPVYGTHRPVWPVYGEYVFVPKQRWIHSMEHGAVVMLYHPCANNLEVKRLKNLVTTCLRRHIITPYSLLSEERPLALVAWGCRLEMSYVNPEVVQHFIRQKALRGPEAISRDGIFDDGIIRRSKIIMDEDDSTLCPQN